MLPHPMVTPERTMIAPASARALPPRMARPTLTSHEDAANGNQQHGQQSGGTQPAPVERRGNQGAPGNVPAQTSPTQPQNRPSQPNQPAYSNNRAGGTQANPQPAQQGGMVIQGGVRPPNPARGTEQLPGAAAPAPRVQMPNAGQQQLYNRSVPPPPRPSFEQQRNAIQSTLPGRPLGPQQLDNLRENRPVGQPQMREAAPHPAPAPAPAAAR